MTQKLNIIGPLCALFTLLATSELMATPRMSLTAGTPCSGCHFSPNGGGGRTELGWGSMNTVGAITYDQLGLSALHEQESNTLLSEQVMLGFDARLQWARLGRPEYNENNEVSYPDLTMIPMQLQPYIGYKPTHDVTLYGSFMPGPDLMNRDGGSWEPAKQVYPGMSAYEAWAMYSLNHGTINVRAGQLQPTFGIRHDDHTIMIRGDGLNRRVPVIPPNFTELGADVSYQPMRWLRADLSVVDTTNLDASLNRDGVLQLEGQVKGEAPNTLWPVATSARVMLMPQFTFGGGGDASEDEFGDDFGDDFDAEPAEVSKPVTMNAWLGGSIYMSGDFMMLNGFFAAGIDRGLSLIGELMWSKRTIYYRQLNMHLGLSYALKNWLSLHARVERAQTHKLTTLIDEVGVTEQYVVGAELFVLPYIELRPEYRLSENLDYRFGFASLQVHMFY